MASLVVEQHPLAVKIRDVIRAADLRSEIARPPIPSAGQQAPKTPYVIVIPIEGGEFYGPALDGPESCATQLVQLTTVGDSARQALLAADRARTAILGRSGGVYVNNLDTAADLTFGTPAQKVRGRWSNGPGGLESDDTLFNLHERFGFFVSL